MTLAQGEQAQYGVVDAQLALPLELAEQAIAIVPRGLRAAAGNGAEQRRGAEVMPPTIRSTPAPAAAPAAMPPPIFTPSCLRVSGLNRSSPSARPAAADHWPLHRPAKGIQAQQRLDAALFAVAHGIVQFTNGAALQFRLCGHAASAGGDIHQQFGDQSLAAGQTCGSLGLVVLDQSLQLGARLFQQQRQAFVQPALTVHGWRHAVEAHQCMQAEAGRA